MFIVAGIYNWSARLVAFRRDLCASCQRETLALGTRTLDFLHVFWLPVLPLGRWTRWRCDVCGKDPSVTTAVRRPFRVLLWFLVVLVVLAFVSVAEDGSEYPIPAWMGRALAGTIVLLVGWWAFRPIGSKAYQQRRAAVQPFRANHGIVRERLRARGDRQRIERGFQDLRCFHLNPAAACEFMYLSRHSPYGLPPARL